MRKLIGVWALIALTAVICAYVIMTPKPAANAAPNADQEEAASNSAQSFSLATVHIEIENRFETVDHITAAEFANEFAGLDNQDVLIFDTRPAREYNVSHIKGAVQLDPKISSKEFARNYGARAQGKTLVFYCSVGMRSSNVAARVTRADGLQDAAQGFGPVYNLRRGLFGWHNENRPLVNAQGRTDKIHPFDKKWGELVSDKNSLSYE